MSNVKFITPPSALYAAVNPHAADVKAAERLRRSRSLARNRKPGVGPRVAKATA